MQVSGGGRMEEKMKHASCGMKEEEHGMKEAHSTVKQGLLAAYQTCV